MEEAVPQTEPAVAMEAEAADNLDVFEPSRLMAELKEKAKQPSPENLPDQLPWHAIKTLPGLFQPRGSDGTDEKHIQDLKRAVENQGALEPVEVMWIGSDPYLIDGHHRMFAYEQAGFDGLIPVKTFTGTVEEAVLAAGAANSKAKLPMDSQTRQNYAWKLVLLGGYSKAETAKAASVSERTIANMRTAKKKLGVDAIHYDIWWRALQAANGVGDEPFDPDAHDDWLEQQAQAYADRLTHEFTNKLSRNPEIAGRALAIYFGRNLPDVVVELQHHADRIKREDEGLEPDF
ncbi:ParB/RepB/Spo0J family partition protein [Kaistia algarum]|uniref:ParB/RepB/Spo0J family partition protein n=1 Tax=Kaistia algarum TaxID=2083279 RepID=UPI0022580DDD|nr:ParB/RepB/Spo0J family partition protein [Kaistia algarum]MCX5513745.1 ParB/RepB/Spo0J family partition protein [Kaistia algarum]